MTRLLMRPRKGYGMDESFEAVYARCEAVWKEREARRRRRSLVLWVLALIAVAFIFHRVYTLWRGPGGLAGYQQRSEQIEELRDLEALAAEEEADARREAARRRQQTEQDYLQYGR